MTSNLDPRLLIAQTLRGLKKYPELKKEFNKQLNNEIGSPEEAIQLCLKFLEMQETS